MVVISLPQQPVDQALCRSLGMNVSDFRASVQETLVELQACTHLNDMLRCLAEVPALADHL